MIAGELLSLVFAGIVLWLLWAFRGNIFRGVDQGKTELDNIQDSLDVLVIEPHKEANELLREKRKQLGQAFMDAMNYAEKDEDGTNVPKTIGNKPFKGDL